MSAEIEPEPISIDVRRIETPRPKRSEEQIVRDWVNLQGEKVVRTHRGVDADAALSVALILELFPNIKLEFKPPSHTTDELRVLAVDMLNGSNAVKGLKQGSAFGLLVNVFGARKSIVKKCFKLWADQINLTDSAKQCGDRVVFADLIKSWRKAGLNDYTIVNRVRELVRGKMKNERGHKKTKKISSSVPIKDSVGIAVDNRIDRGTIFRRGAKAIIQKNNSGMAIHLSKKVMKSGRNLTELEPLLPSTWFVHPDGFIAVFGGPKNPKNPDESGISLEALHHLVSSWLKELN